MISIIIATVLVSAPPAGALPLANVDPRDGDTIKCSILLPLGITLRDEVIRAGDYDACESSKTRRAVTVTNEEVRVGKAAKLALKELVAKSKVIWYVPYAKRDVYGRRLGKLYADDLSLKTWAEANKFTRQQLPKP